MSDPQYKPHAYEILDHGIYADTAFLNALPASCPVWHQGFGDFVVRGPAGEVKFLRADGVEEVVKAARWSGRPHKLVGKPEAVLAVVRELFPDFHQPEETR